MYKATDRSQLNFNDFNQHLGLEMNPENRWIKMADQVPWNRFEEKYAALFPSGTGNVANPLRMALGSLIIQTKYGFSDTELVEQLTENPYYQYFIGLSGYQKTAPFEASVLVAFRKRISSEMLMEVNECLLENPNKEKDDDEPKPGSGSSSDSTKGADEPSNEGTLILDATCAPSNIRYPQDYSLLNEARYYFDKRTKDWIKFKVLEDKDYIICGYTFSGGMTSLILGQFKKKELIYKGKVAFGVRYHSIKDYGGKIIDHSPFNLTPSGIADTIWLAPNLVCTVEFMPNDRGSLRQPVFKGIRDDISPDECID